MGRNKELNKIRKRTSQPQERGGGPGKAREATTAAAGGGRRPNAGEADGADNRRRGALRKLFAFFLAYPFVAITVVIALPRALPIIIRWARLRSGILGPVAQVHQEKQVLIVGTMGSGTAQMSRELMRLGVEVGHEISDSEHELCRDGTISWVHGIRFLSGSPNLSLLCSGPRHHAYHSTMFQASPKCSYYFRSWDQCWENECRKITAREFGCALSRDGMEAGGGDGCATPFRKNFLQVRHPLHTVASLSYKSSGSKESLGRDCSNAQQQLTAITSFFPNKIVREHLGGMGAAFAEFDWTEAREDCVSTWAWYWVVYNRAMLRAADSGVLDGWYRVEDTPPSKVAALAGFSSATINQALEDGEEGKGPGQGERRGYHNQKNLGGFEITWQDIASYPGGLLREVSDLAVELGYDGAPGFPPRSPPSPRDAPIERGGVPRDGDDSSPNKGWRGLLARWGKGKRGGRRKR